MWQGREGDEARCPVGAEVWVEEGDAKVSEDPLSAYALNAITG